VINPTSILKII